MNIFDHPHSQNGRSSNLSKVTLRAVVDSYLEFYAASSSHTARAKRLDLEALLAFMANLNRCTADKVALTQWSYSSVQRFIEHCLNKNESPATVSRRLATLKHMGRALAEKVPGFINPARDVKAPKVQTVKPKALSAQEIKRVRTAAKNRYDEKPSFIRARNLALLELLLETGLRADEIRLLKIGQLDESFKWIQQVRTKGRRFRNVYIPSSVRTALKIYLKQREHELKRFFPALTVAQNKKLPLFLSSYKCDSKDLETFVMSPKTLWRAVSQMTKELKLHPHLLRHSFAVDFLESSKDIRLVSQALGHSDVRITMRYTERRDEEVAAALEQRKNK